MNKNGSLHRMKRLETTAGPVNSRYRSWADTSTPWRVGLTDSEPGAILSNESMSGKTHLNAKKWTVIDAQHKNVAMLHHLAARLLAARSRPLESGLSCRPTLIALFSSSFARSRRPARNGDFAYAIEPGMVSSTSVPESSSLLRASVPHKPGALVHARQAVVSFAPASTKNLLVNSLSVVLDP